MSEPQMTPRPDLEKAKAFGIEVDGKSTKEIMELMIAKLMEAKPADTGLLDANKRSAITSSWNTAYGIKKEVAQHFYTELHKDEEVKALFANSNMEEQHEKLMDTINAAIGLLEKPDELVPILKKLGRRHVGYKVEDKHYDVVGAALLATFAHFLKDAFTDELKGWWTELYGIIASTMKEGAKESD